MTRVLKEHEEKHFDRSALKDVKTFSLVPEFARDDRILCQRIPATEIHKNDLCYEFLHLIIAEFYLRLFQRNPDEFENKLHITTETLLFDPGIKIYFDKRIDKKAGIGYAQGDKVSYFYYPLAMSGYKQKIEEGLFSSAIPRKYDSRVPFFPFRDRDEIETLGKFDYQVDAFQKKHGLTKQTPLILAFYWIVQKIIDLNKYPEDKKPYQEIAIEHDKPFIDLLLTSFRSVRQEHYAKAEEFTLEEAQRRVRDLKNIIHEYNLILGPDSEDPKFLKLFNLELSTLQKAFPALLPELPDDTPAPSEAGDASAAGTEDDIMAPFAAEQPAERAPLRVKEDDKPENKIQIFAEHWIHNLFAEGHRVSFGGGEHGVEEDYKEENVNRWFQEQLTRLFRDWNDQNDPKFMIHPKELLTKQSKPPVYFRLRFRGAHGDVAENDVQFQMVGMVPPVADEKKAYPQPDLRRTQDKMRKHQNWINFHKWYASWTQKYPGERVVEGETPKQVEFMEPKPKPKPKPKPQSGWAQFAERTRVPGTQTGSDEESEAPAQPNLGFASMDDGWGGHGADAASESDWSDDENRPIAPRQPPQVPEEREASPEPSPEPERRNDAPPPRRDVLPLSVDTINVTWSGGVKFAVTSVVLTILWALLTRRQN